MSDHRTEITQPAPADAKAIPWGRIALVLALLLVFGAAGLGVRLVNRCFNWHHEGMNAPLDQRPMAVIQNLASLISEPLCQSQLDADVWVRLAKAYQQVPEVDDLNRRRALGSWQEASILQPNNPTVLSGLADAFIDLGQFNYALRPASSLYRLSSGDADAARRLVSIYLALDDELAAADLLSEQFVDGTYLTGNGLAGKGRPPVWARLAVETIMAGVHEDAAMQLAGLSETFAQPSNDPEVRLAQAVTLAFRLGLDGDQNAMATALSQLPIGDVAAADRLDVIKIYEQLGLIQQIADALKAVPTASLANGEKLRLARILWLLEDHSTLLDRFGQDLAFKRQNQEAGLIVTLAGVA
ncbi:MAG: hypothetical protein AAF556_13255, partial [Pseudomonadota bacterium]